MSIEQLDSSSTVAPEITRIFNIVHRADVLDDLNMLKESGEQRVKDFYARLIKTSDIRHLNNGYSTPTEHLPRRNK